MLLVLFYLEDLRRLILSSTKPMQSGDPFEVARGILVAEGVISQRESDELPSLLEYRNVVGDGLHQFTDIGAYSALVAFSPGDGQRYGHSVVQHVKAIRKKVTLGMRQCLFPPTSLDIRQSDALEQTFQREIAHLKVLVNQGLRHRINQGPTPN
jgi:hypothetical protein